MEKLTKKIRHLRYKPINPNKNRHSNIPNTSNTNNILRYKRRIPLIPKRWYN